MGIGYPQTVGHPLNFATWKSAVREPRPRKWVQTHEISSARGKAPHDPVKRGTHGIKVGIWSDECHVQHQTPLPLQSDQPDALGDGLTVHTDHRLSQHFHTLGRSSAHANLYRIPRST